MLMKFPLLPPTLLPHHRRFSLSRSQKHMPGPLKPSSSRDLDYFSALPTPDSLKRFPQMLPHSTAFLCFPLIFCLCLSNSSARMVWSVSEIWLFFLKYMSSYQSLYLKLSNRRFSLSMVVIVSVTLPSHFGVNCC